MKLSSYYILQVSCQLHSFASDIVSLRTTSVYDKIQPYKDVGAPYGCNNRLNTLTKLSSLSIHAVHTLLSLMGAQRFCFYILADVCQSVRKSAEIVSAKITNAFRSGKGKLEQTDSFDIFSDNQGFGDCWKKIRSFGSVYSKYQLVLSQPFNYLLGVSSW